MSRAEEASTPSGRVCMKEQARLFAERLTPKRMTVVAKGKERGTDREIEILTFGEIANGNAYYRRTDQTPEPYPIVKRDRVNGTIKSVTMARPTAPLRRVR